jgi:hypothetical protein
VIYVEGERTPFEKLVSQMGGARIEAWIASMVGNAARNILPVAAMPGVAREAQHDLAWIIDVADQAKNSGNPFTAYAHCLCKAE